MNHYTSIKSFLLTCIVCVTIITASFGQANIPAIYLNPVINNKTAKGIQVRYAFHQQTAQATVLYFDLMQPYLQRTSDTIAQLSVKDKNGDACYKHSGDTVIDTRTLQVWKPARTIAGDITVDYFVHTAIAFPVKRGPHIDLQAAGNGLSGSLTGILLLPLLGDTISTKLAWQLPADHHAVSSAGEGDVTIHTDFTSFLSTQFMEGSFFAYPKENRSKGFSFFALGQDANEMQLAAAWPGKAYNVLREKLLGSKDKPFRVFIRTYDGGPLQSGVAVNGCFTVYLPPGMPALTADIHSLIAHEMVHAFVEGLNSEEEGLNDWYNEGIADYLSLKIPYEAGLYTPGEYDTLINEEAALYYTNAIRETPEKDIPAVKWSGRNAWSIGYSRGALYFTNLDAKLKRFTQGKLTVTDLINEITQLNRSAKKATDSSWINLLQEKAGDWAVKDWQDMMNGKLIIPEPDCYPGFALTQITTGIFDLGFKQPLSIRAGEHIKDLDTNSAAAKAGLEDGDEIANTIAINDAYTSYDNTLTITVRRNGALIPITFKPRKGKYVAYKWTKQ
jgi:hypothetical protein